MAARPPLVVSDAFAGPKSGWALSRVAGSIVLMAKHVGDPPPDRNRLTGGTGPDQRSAGQRAVPRELIGCFVVEVGLRQAWPFLTFCDNRPATRHGRPGRSPAGRPPAGSRASDTAVDARRCRGSGSMRPRSWLVPARPIAFFRASCPLPRTPKADDPTGIVPTIEESPFRGALCCNR